LRPEAAQFLDIARNMLMRGLRMLDADLIEDAGRAAYLVAFHAAQALISERENRTLKTHRGVQSEFSKLIRDDALVPADLRGFLSRAYAFKTIADYDPMTSVPPTEQDARAAIETAGRFVEEVAGSSGRPQQPGTQQISPRPDNPSRRREHQDF
jgi:uncharacterized protein (UPF0332 family)